MTLLTRRPHAPHHRSMIFRRDHDVQEVKLWFVLFSQFGIQPLGLTPRVAQVAKHAYPLI